MTLAWLGEDDAVLWHGDVRAMLAEVPDASVQCVVTSPPYFGLRDYGTAEWEGGAANCEHKGRPKPRQDTSGGGPDKGRFAETRGTQPGKCAYAVSVRTICGVCGARRVDQQIGLEETPAEYVEAMTAVFREVRRVLRDDGVCWLNLGDSYANDGKWGGSSGGKHAGGLHGATGIGRGKTRTGLKAKDLIGMPWEIAFALRDDGWYLRADGIWSKPNPMPESVTDRLTKSHEYIFLLTKNERYYWDQENAKEDASGRAAGNKRPRKAVISGGEHARTQRGLAQVSDVAYTSRNLRSVWEITTRPYPGAHFATFPTEIPRRCIRASTPEGGCCSSCRKPYRRLVEKGEPLAAQRAACGADTTGGYGGHATKDYAAGKAQDPSAVKARILAGMVEKRTIGWQAQCACPGGVPVPSLVLDPFAGSGTTLAVAIEEGRRALGFELNGDYIGLALERIDQARGARKGAA